MGRRGRVILLLLVGTAAASLYLCAVVRQKHCLNLSATAGGQYPYLRYAHGFAAEGLLHHWGDRNRMPLVPALLSLLGDADGDTLLTRGAWFSIVSSLVCLAVIGGIAYRVLSPPFATVLLLSAAFCAFLERASFVQAEVLYYTLFFCLWLVLCRLLRRPTAGWAILAGALAAVTYLTKASVLLTLPVFACSIVLQALPAVPRRVEGRSAVPSRRFLLAGLLVIVVFALVASPYLLANRARFGRCFYNVNSTFYFWCDNWQQAGDLARAYDLTSGYPDALPHETPGLSRYWRTHTVAQVFQRLRYGVRTLGDLALQAAYGRYLIVVGALFVVLVVSAWRHRPPLDRADFGVAVFCALLLGGYVLVYAWYVPIGYGDRFVLSLFLPTLFGMLWLTDRLVAHRRSLPRPGWLVRAPSIVNTTLVVLLLGQGAWATATACQPPPLFVAFYHAESLEAGRAGDLAEAQRGFAGVLRLDPHFVPALRDLGMLHLQQRHWPEAIDTLSTAVRLDPHHADLHNSLGSALVQAGRAPEALAAFQRAVELDPTFDTAWYNLGGTCHALGQLDDARVARDRLFQVNPKLAQQLDQLLAP
ncbi:MAG TPA: tetratricopeptide repeat protein [Phycisphaerae bacterium]|nr:tetratricopeptide repeat protein [Phycisphaerae bacterium]HNU45295.1 tetratricopeptide repeat protein [Phycisphaerae bacterium]